MIEVGGPGTLAQSIRAVRVGGHISLIGVLTGAAGDVPTALLMARQARLQGLLVGSRRDQADFVRALEATGLRPVIDRRRPLAEAADAVIDRTRLWRHATSLGGVESTLERRRRWAAEAPTIPAGLVRLSVGIENVEDLFADLDAALGARG